MNNNYLLPNYQMHKSLIPIKIQGRPVLDLIGISMSSLY